MEAWNIKHSKKNKGNFYAIEKEEIMQVRRKWNNIFFKWWKKIKRKTPVDL